MARADEKIAIEVVLERGYIDRPLTEDEKKDGHYVQGKMPGPCMRETEEVGSNDARKNLKPGMGNLCIGVKAGDKLGELDISVQYEGPRGRYDECMNRHNDLLEASGKWIRDILGTMCPNTEWKAKIETGSSFPPEANAKVAFERAVSVVEARQQTAQQQDVHDTVDVRRDVIEEVKSGDNP